MGIGFSQTEKLIVGKWKYVQMTDTTKLDEEGKRLSARFFTDFTMQFSADQKYRHELMGKVETGTYTLSGDAKVLTEKSDNGGESKLVLFEVGPERITVGRGTKGSMVLQRVEATQEIVLAENPKTVAVTENQITGRWKITEYITKKGNNMAPDNGFYEFAIGGVFRADVIVEETGAWKLGPDKTTIELLVEGYKSEFFILDCTKDKLVVIKGKNGRRMTLERTKK